MQLATAIAQIFASIVGYFSARGIDAIIAKYLAALQVAFDKAATQAARETFRKSRDEISKGLESKYSEWEKWRNGSGA